MRSSINVTYNKSIRHISWCAEICPAFLQGKLCLPHGKKHRLWKVRHLHSS